MRAAIDEESKQLLRRIIESMAWRQLASINMLGHSLKFIPDIEVKATVAAELDLALRLFREVRSLYGELGWTDLESAVRDRAEAIEYPRSRLEFGVAYFLLGVAEHVAMESYVDSACSDFAAIARSHVEAARGRPEPKRFIEYCADPTNHPQAQQFISQWSEIARSAFGRGASTSDRRAVELNLRSRSVVEMAAEFDRQVQPFLRRCGLADALAHESDAPH